MKPPYITEAFLQQFIDSALTEDIGDGDHSTLASIHPDAQKKAKLLVKDEGVLAGVTLARQIFEYVDRGLKMDTFIHDGQPIKYEDIAFTIAGSARTILTKAFMHRTRQTAGRPRSSIRRCTKPAR